MAGLCEGGNEPPGSLKAIDESYDITDNAQVLVFVRYFDAKRKARIFEELSTVTVLEKNTRWCTLKVLVAICFTSRFRTRRAARSSVSTEYVKWLRYRKSHSVYCTIFTKRSLREEYGPCGVKGKVVQHTVSFPFPRAKFHKEVIEQFECDYRTA
ncbi:hypothetical protein ANN_27353 [Periplaneta americana]|uniref:Uncharacterized protein n=1 Tax=Periplaneta americana TaxID=6978 RepID=A0ABQ8RXV9_PERAM|nr:hypothetical protein ANN_27353 [Periplaneta americana]